MVGGRNHPRSGLRGWPQKPIGGFLFSFSFFFEKNKIKSGFFFLKIIVNFHWNNYSYHFFRGIGIHFRKEIVITIRNRPLLNKRITIMAILQTK
jgi:hypothetical protein